MLLHGFLCISSSFLASSQGKPEADIDLNGPHTSTYVTQREIIHSIRSCVHTVRKRRETLTR